MDTFQPIAEIVNRLSIFKNDIYVRALGIVSHTVNQMKFW